MQLFSNLFTTTNKISKLFTEQNPFFDRVTAKTASKPAEENVVKRKRSAEQPGIALRMEELS
jgi:hypothetical protein